MTKEILVSITGSHLMEGETEDISVITAGSYYFKNGKHYIVYDEHLDDGNGSIRNTIKVGPDTVEMIKGGDARTHMVFERHKTNLTCYATPYGQMMIGVTTNRIEMVELPDELRVHIDYSMEVNYEKTSDCHVEIEVSSKAAAKLRLQE
ncbi:MAG: DUF1934 domain-containing protein [Clostridium sp.]|nr:DUF1934 domain-containing protein [Clostridiaceae bacterium]MDD6074609.1 DUF1934 domain-containing protein [Clostridium sp.]MDY5483176.1 DUF1934 domain-containing protein [Clostridium sp.]